MQTIIISSILGYFIGSIPFSYIVGKKTKNVDIRNYGSGNLGSTNVFRVSGKKAGIIAFLLDFSKGVSAYLLGYYIFGYTGAIFCTAFAVIGHCYSVFTNFKGGKGVATTFGIIVMFNPLLALILIFIQFIIIKTTKYMSLASIMTAIFAPVLSIILKMDVQFTYLTIFLGIFISYRHRSNISRLLKGTENKFKI